MNPETKENLVNSFASVTSPYAVGDVDRIINACERLSKRVKDVPEMLEKLAKLSEEKPQMFGIYTAMFKKM